jgi:hypothetical protein
LRTSPPRSLRCTGRCSSVPCTGGTEPACSMVNGRCRGGEPHHVQVVPVKACFVIVLSAAMHAFLPSMIYTMMVHCMCDLPRWLQPVTKRGLELCVSHHTVGLTAGSCAVCNNKDMYTCTCLPCAADYCAAEHVGKPFACVPHLHRRSCRCGVSLSLCHPNWHLAAPMGLLRMLQLMRVQEVPPHVRIVAPIVRPAAAGLAGARQGGIRYAREIRRGVNQFPSARCTWVLSVVESLLHVWSRVLRARQCD